MKQETTDLIIVMTKGIYDEVSSVGLVIANGALTSGKTVGLFLTSSAIDLVRKNGIEHTQVHPMDSVKDLLTSFMDRGGDVWCCPPCTSARGYDSDCLIDGVVIQGASVIMDRIKDGAATLTF